MDPVTAEISRTSRPFDYVAHLKKSKRNSSVKWQLAALKILNVQHAWEVPLSLVGYMRGMTVYVRGNSDEVKTRFHETRNEIHLMCVEFMERYVELSQHPMAKQDRLACGRY